MPICEEMQTYHVGDTYPPIDVLLERKDSNDDLQYIDPSGATQITVKVRINGTLSTKLSANLSNNVSIVVDGDALNRVRMKFVTNDLDTVGIYQLIVILTWADGTETTPLPHEFKVVSAWT